MPGPKSGTHPSRLGAQRHLLPDFGSEFRGRVLALIVIALSLIVGFSNRSLAVSLQEAVQAALLTSPDIGIVAENPRAIDYELEQAWSLFRPQVVCGRRLADR